MEISCGTAVMGKETKNFILRNIGMQLMLWNDILLKYVSFMMQTYLTEVWGLSFTHAAGILNVWEGIQMILPAFILSTIDDFLSNFMALVICGAANAVGMCLIAMSTPPVFAKVSGTCKWYESDCIGHPQKVIFYTGMVLVAVALAGYNVSLLDFFKDQGDGELYEEIYNDINTVQRKPKRRYFIMSFVLYLTPSLLAAALPQADLWSLRFGVPAIFTLFAVFIFSISSSLYKKEKRDQPSPITTVFRVITASTLKISQPFEKDATKLYEGVVDGKTLKISTYVRFLEKAAIVENPQNPDNRKWKLSKVKEVEQAKIVVHMIPMWITFVMCGIVSSIGNTYLVEQLNNLNRQVGRWDVPLSIFFLLTDFGRYVFSKFVRYLCQKVDTKHEKYRNAPIVGVAVAMIFLFFCCISAALVERRRLNIIQSYGLLDDDFIPMHAYWLFFPFFLLALGGVDTIKDIATIFYRHAASDPEYMENYLNHFTEGVFGLSYISGVLSVYVVGRISESGGRPSWFQFTLNQSQLDNYYWVLAALMSVNLFIFTVLACFYYWDRNVEEASVDTLETREDSTSGAEGLKRRISTDQRRENGDDTSVMEIVMEILN